MTSALLRIAESKGKEMLLWCCQIAREIASACLGMWTLPDMVRVGPEQRRQVTAALRMLAAQELLDEPASERLLSEATLVWHLHVSEADADERKRLRLDAPQSARLGAMLLLHDPTPELLGLIGRIAAVPELVETFAVTCGLLLRHLRTESAGGSGVTPMMTAISDIAAVAIEHDGLFKAANVLDETDNAATEDVMESSQMAPLLVAICELNPGHRIVGVLLDIMLEEGWVIGRLVESGFLPIMHNIVRSSNSNFERGAMLVTEMVVEEKLEWLWEAGPGLLIHMLRSSADKEVQRCMAGVLPKIFQHCDRTKLLRHAPSTMNHLVALIETSSTSIELDTVCSSFIHAPSTGAARGDPAWRGGGVAGVGVSARDVAVILAPHCFLPTTRMAMFAPALPLSVGPCHRRVPARNRGAGDRLRATRRATGVG